MTQNILPSILIPYYVVLYPQICSDLPKAEHEKLKVYIIVPCFLCTVKYILKYIIIKLKAWPLTI